MPADAAAPQPINLHLWAATVATNEGENVSVPRVLLSEWAREKDGLLAVLKAARRCPEAWSPGPLQQAIDAYDAAQPKGSAG